MSRFPWQRGRAQLVMLGALAVLVALVTATAVAAVGFVERRSGEISSEQLRAATAASGALVLQTRLGDDPDAQDAAWSAQLATRAPGGSLEVVRLLITEPLTLGVQGRAEEPASRTSLASAAWLPDQADLVSGSWLEDAPAVEPGRIAAVVPHASAQELGVEVGDVLLLGRGQDTAVEIVGTWEPREAAAPAGSGSARSTCPGPPRPSAPCSSRWTTSPPSAATRSSGGRSSPARPTSTSRPRPRWPTASPRWWPPSTPTRPSPRAG
ncbi:hypothetical protein [Serinibacter arcticus]|uniref:hypothetical protein n=1 Tax=Serinibacter arcticus TaxID=1655435 RepID=UPI002E260E97